VHEAHDAVILTAVTVVQKEMKKALTETQTLRWRNRKFSPHHKPLLGGAGQPKFNELQMVNTFTYKPSLVKIDARNFELSW